MALTNMGKILGVATLSAASFINVGCSSNPKPTTVYDPVHRMIEADSNGDGILTKSEARKDIFDHYKTVYWHGRGRGSTSKLTKEGLERARADGTNAMRFMPEHAKMFLAAVDEWEKELNLGAQK